MTEQEKNKLTANAVLAGRKGNDPRAVVENAIYSQATQSTEFTPDYQKDMSTSGAGSGSSGALTDKNPMEILIQGEIPTTEVYRWNNASGLELQVPSMGSAKLLDLNNKPLGYAKLSEVNKSQVGVVSDLGKITFGGKVVNMSDFEKIAASNEDAHKVYLPVKDGVPDLNYLEKVENANKEIATFENITPYEASTIYNNYGLKVNQFGELETANLKPFVIFTGYTTDEATVTDNNSFIKELSSNEESTLEEALKPAFARQEDGKDKGKLPLGRFYETWYKGIVAYPLKENATAEISSFAGNLYDTKKTIMDVKLNAAGKNLGTGNAQLLNLTE